MTGSLEDPGELAGVGVQPLAGLVGADLAPAEVWLLRHHLACTGHSEVRLMSHVTCHMSHSPGEDIAFSRNIFCIFRSSSACCLALSLFLMFTSFLHILDTK